MFRRVRFSLATFFVLVTWSAPGPSGAADVTNYEGQVRPILRERCFHCHNAQKLSGGLALDSYAAAMQGGSSGEVIYGGDLEGSRLWALVNHEDEPAMPPNQDKLPDAQLAVLRTWIEQGALERADSAPVVRKSIELPVASNPAADDMTPGAMPEGLICQPVTLSARPAAAASIAVSPRAPLAAVASPRQIVLVHLDTAELVGILPFPERMPLVVRFSRDGALLLAGGGRGGLSGLTAVYDVHTGQRLATYGDELDTVLATDLLASGSRVALGGPGRLVRGFDTQRGEPRYENDKHTDWVLAMEFSPDNRFLASADRQGGLVVWEAESGREYQVLQGHTQAITGLSWRLDSKALATVSEDGNVSLWDPEAVAPLRTWAAHGGGALDVEFDRQGRLVTAGRDANVKLWDAAGQPLASFPMKDIALSAAIDAMGNRVVAGDWTGQVKVWGIEPQAELTAFTTNPPGLQDRVAELQRQFQATDAASQAAKAQLEALASGLHTADAAYQTALSSMLTARTALATARQSQSGLEAPADLSPQEAALADLERRVGQAAAELKQRGDEHAAGVQAELTARQSLDAVTTSRDKATERLQQYRERPARLQQHVAEAEQSIQQAKEAVAREEALLVALQSLQAAAIKVAELQPSPGESETLPSEDAVNLGPAYYEGLVTQQQVRLEQARQVLGQSEAAHASAIQARDLFQSIFPHAAE